MTVLQYIKNQTKRFHMFVANRVAVIYDGSLPGQWRHIDSKSNPADDASRGLSAEKMVMQQRWKQGPEFLWNVESEWPKIPDISFELLEADTEVKQQTKSCVAEVLPEKEDIIDRLLNRYSCWYRLRKAVAWVLRFKSWLREGKAPDSSCLHQHLKVDDLKEAETAIVKYLQQSTYHAELQALGTDGGTVSRSSSIYELEPFRDSDGILRITGRLQVAPLDYETKHPIILSKNHHVTELVIRYVHEIETTHSGKEHVLTQIRQKYWIPKCRPLIKRILRSCIICQKLQAMPKPQRMANLPEDRVTPGKTPFSSVGVDCFGPFYVKRGRGQEKRYGCLFTCLSIRGVHIEKLFSMSADSFINALMRFIARRGVPELIRSDNGTNFVGGEKELRESVQSWNESIKLREYLLVKQIKWIFNPPAASHMGGVWERQIRTVRKVLNVTLRNQTLDDERLDTVFCEVENIVNSRPITSISDDPTDLKPLTPNHILHLKGGLIAPMGNFTKHDAYGRHWRHVQVLADNFWKRWKMEYLTCLQLRNKWYKPARNLEPGDIVIVLNEATVRSCWPLGHVLRTFPGRDSLVRSAEVKTSSGVLVRPVTKLCVLEGVK